MTPPAAIASGGPGVPPVAVLFFLAAATLLSACSPRPELIIDNQTLATLKGHVQLPIEDTLGRVRAGRVLFVRVVPGQTWSSRSADDAERPREPVEDVVVRLADASLIAQSARPLGFAYPARIGLATVTIRDPGDGSSPKITAVDAAGNPVELFRPPAPIALPPDNRRPVLEAPELKQDLFR